jgi:hypothetical protein
MRSASAIAVVMVAACGGGAGEPDAGGGDDGAEVDAGGEVVCPGERPDETNTGVSEAVALTQVDGDVMVDGDGTVIEGQDIHGFLRIAASNVTVRDSIVRGRATDATTAIIRIDDGVEGVVIEDSIVDAAEPSVGVDGIWASNAVIRRVEVTGGVDAMKLGDDTRVECSYLHDLVSFESDPNQGGGPTHNDAIQILAGASIEIVGNTLLAAMDQNAAIQITQDFGAVTDVHIEHNWGDGGGCTFNFSHNGGGGLTVVSRDNRFGRGSFYDCPILKSTQTTLDSEGDVWDDDGTPVPVQTHD